MLRNEQKLVVVVESGKIGIYFETPWKKTEAFMGRSGNLKKGLWWKGWSLGKSHCHKL